MKVQLNIRMNNTETRTWQPSTPDEADRHDAIVHSMTDAVRRDTGLSIDVINVHRSFSLQSPLNQETAKPQQIGGQVRFPRLQS